MKCYELSYDIWYGRSLSALFTCISSTGTDLGMRENGASWRRYLKFRWIFNSPSSGSDDFLILFHFRLSMARAQLKVLWQLRPTLIGSQNQNQNQFRLTRLSRFDFGFDFLPALSRAKWPHAKRVFWPRSKRGLRFDQAFWPDRVSRLRQNNATMDNQRQRQHNNHKNNNIREVGI